MTVARLIPLAIRSGLLIGAGTALLVMPLILGLSAAAVVTGIAVGALAVALGVAGTSYEGRGTLPVSAQAGYDRGLAFGLLAAAIVFGLSGDAAALAFFGVAGMAALAITLTTRYTAAPA
jgi:hypothetical protein